MKTRELIFTTMISLSMWYCGSAETVESQDVNESRVYGRYEVTYDEDQDKLEFFVKYRIGSSTGPTIKLTDPSKVEVEGAAMSLRNSDHMLINLTGSYYKYSAPASDIKEDYEFTWTRLDGLSFKNSIITPKSIQILEEDIPDSMSLSESLQVQTQIEDTLINEDVHCHLTADRHDGWKHVQKKAAPDGSCTFHPRDIAEFGPGLVVLQVQRCWTGEPTEGHGEVGGRLMSRYYSKKVPITLKRGGAD